MADRETIVVKDGGSGMGLIVGIIAIIAIVAVVWYVALGPGAGAGTGNDNGTTINVELPSIAPQGS